MTNKKISLKIFILPYICTSIFLVCFFKTHSTEFLEFALISLSFNSLCLICEFIFLKVYKKLYGEAYNFLFIKSIKITVALSAFYIFLCTLLFALNFFTKIYKTSEILINLTALLFSVLPLTLFLISEITFFRLKASLKSKKIKLINPNCLEDIYDAKILIIDKFDAFSNLNTLKNISEYKNIILVSDLSERKIRYEYEFLINNAKFCKVSSDELPSLKPNTINIYSSADILSVIKLIKLLNKAFIIVSDQDLNTLCCKISQKNTSDLTIAEKDVYLIDAILNSVHINFNNFKKCIVYQLTLSVAKIICIFSCVFFCSQMPFTPLMLISANLILDILPMLALVFDNSNEIMQDRLSHIILDSLLLGIVSFIVFMVASISFPPSCASLICTNTFIISSLLYAVNLRSEKSIFFIGILTNKLTNISFVSGISITVIFTLLLSNELSFTAWLLISAMAMLPFIVNQLQKALVSIFYN